MPVAVVHPDRHQRHRRPDRVEETEILVRRPVVGHLQHVGAEPVGGEPFQQFPLLFGLGVPGEQDAYRTDGGGEHQRVVVGVRAGAAQRGGACSGVPGSATRPARTSRGATGATGTRAAGCRLRDQGPAGRRLVPLRGAAPPRPAGRGTPRRRRPTWSAWKWLTTSSGTSRTPSRRRQPSTGGGLRPGVDHHRPSRRDRQHDRVALPDGAGGHHPAGRRPAGGEQPHRYRTGRHGEHHDQHQTGGPARRRKPISRSTVTAASSSATADPAGPGQRPGGQPRAVPGHRHQPPGGPARQPGDELGAGRPDGGQHRRDHAEHRRRGDGGHGEQVRRHRDEAHVGRDARRPPGRTPPARRPGSTSASASPAGTPRRRSASRQPGASSSSPEVASTESANPASAARAGSTTTRTVIPAASAGSAARGRPRASAASPIAPIVAARTTLGEGRTRITKPTRATAQSAAATHGSGARPAGQQQHQPHHERDVGTGDGVEVRHAGVAEVLLDLLGQPAGVPHHQPRQQSALRGRERRAGALQSGAQRSRGALGPGGFAVGDRGGVGGEHRSGEVTALRRLKAAGGGQPLARAADPASAGRSPAPAAGRGRAGAPPSGRSSRTSSARQQEHGGPVRRSAQRAGIVAHHEFGGDPGPLGGELAQRPRRRAPPAGPRSRSPRRPPRAARPPRPSRTGRGDLPARHGGRAATTRHGGAEVHGVRAGAEQVAGERRGQQRGDHGQHGGAGHGEVQRRQRREPGGHGDAGQPQVRRVGR